MGTISGISDLDPIRWKNSQWRNLQVDLHSIFFKFTYLQLLINWCSYGQVGWDESTGGERRNRVSAWEIEPVTAPFFIQPPFFGAKHPRQPGQVIFCCIVVFHYFMEKAITIEAIQFFLFKKR